MRPLAPPTDAHSLVRTAAFQLLLERAKPVRAGEIARVAGSTPERVEQLLDELHDMGRIRRDASGEIVGSAGLSVILDRHAINLEGRLFWTWCAYDIFGIFGALGSNGDARSPSPAGQTIDVQFHGGRPLGSGAVLFRPDDELLSTCANVYEEWCPNSNLFVDAQLAESWAAKQGLRGRIMSLAEASDIGTLEWADAVGSRQIFE